MPIPFASGLCSFADPRDYIRAYLSHQREQNSSLGMRHLSRKAGFASPSTLGMFLNGKRKLTPFLAEKLAAALPLKHKEKQMLQVWSQIECAKNVVDRTRAERKLFQLKSSNENGVMTNSQLRFLSIWYYPVIFTMVGQDDFNPSPSYLAKVLGRGVQPAQVERALRELVEMGLLQKDSRGFKQSKTTLKNSEDVKEISVRHCHRNGLTLAQNALSLPLSEREFNGLTVAVPKEQIPHVKEMIRQFRSDLNLYLSQFTKNSDIYQLSLQFFPLTNLQAAKELIP